MKQIMCSKKILLVFAIAYLKTVTSCIIPGIIPKPSMRCGETTSFKQTIIKSTNSIPNNCEYTFRTYSALVCQLRIDFDIDLAPPTILTNGKQIQAVECIQDYLEINNFKFCGHDRDQHIYIPFYRTAESNLINIKIHTTSNLPTWKLKVTQLECSRRTQLRTGIFQNLFSGESRTLVNDRFWIAPNGCTQYFPNENGIVKSFNFNNGNGIYPAGLNYAICFRRTTKETKLELTPNHFQLGSEPLAAEQLNDFCFSPIPTEGRSEDNLLIPEAIIVSSGIRATRFCGTSLMESPVISSSPGPLMIIFNSDYLYKETSPETGFSFNYRVF